MTLTYESDSRQIRPGRQGSAQGQERKVAYDWQVLDCGLRPKRAVPNGDFAEIDRGIGRLEDVLRDVRLQ